MPWLRKRGPIRVFSIARGRVDMNLKFAAIATATLLTAGAVSASTINVSTQDGGAFGQERHREIVRVHADAAPSVDGRRVYAGLFRLTDGGSVFGDFAAFCVELTEYLRLPNEYTMTTSLFAGETLERMETLFSTSVHHVDNGQDDDSVDAAAFQVALWDVIYDDGTSVTDSPTASFSISGHAAVEARANEFLASLAGAPNTGGGLQFIEAPGTQNLVLIATMPVPAAGLMLLGALGGFAALRRKSRN